MLFYIVMLSLILVVGIPMSLTENKNVRKICMFLETIIFLIVLGLRDMHIGMGDVVNVYMPEYRHILEFSFFDIIKKFKDPIFYVITRICILISNNNISFWLTVCAAAYIIPIMFLIYRESKYPLISIIIFVALNFFGTAFSGLRHCIACGILCFAYKPLNSRELWKFLLIVLFASMFHITSLIFLLAYPIIGYFKNRRISYNWFWGINLIIMFTFIMSKFLGKYIVNEVLNFIINVIGLKRFSIYATEGYSSLNDSLFFINYIIYFVSGYMLCTGKKIKDKENYKNFLILQALGTLLLTLVNSLGEFYRLAYFFIFYSILLVPELLCCFRNGFSRKCFCIFYVGICIYYFLFFGIQNNMIIPYKFTVFTNIL